MTALDLAGSRRHQGRAPGGWVAAVRATYASPGPGGAVLRVVWGPPALAAALAALAWLAGIHGTDQAAQVFRVLEVRQHGLSLIDPSWYGGIYPLSYSVAVPVLGALIGLAASSMVMCALATWAFDRLTTAWLGARSLGSWYFAASTLLQVAIGQLPFLAGEAFGLASVLALGSRRRWAAAGLGVASALCSPLAAAFLAMACLAWGLRAWPGRHTARQVRTAGDAGWWPVGLAAVAMVVVGALALAFPGDGYFPFPWTELVVVEAMCAPVVLAVVRTTPSVRLAVAFYAVATLASFLVPNPLGGNAGRLASAVGVPLLACFATVPGAVRPVLPAHWQRWAAAVVVPFAVWQWAPGLSAVRGVHDAAATTDSFYTPLVSHLAGVAPGASRIEIVPTAEHWEAVYVATTTLSLARGWERQIDTARNPIFYRPGALTPASYRQWLLDQGVTWVALPRIPASQLDYAGVGEAALLRGGVPGLRQVWSDRDWVLWQVEGSPGLVSGPATLASVDADTVDLHATATGKVTVRLRWTPYWTLPVGAGCVAATPEGWTEVEVDAPGLLELHADLGARRGPDCTSG